MQLTGIYLIFAPSKPLLRKTFLINDKPFLKQAKRAGPAGKYTLLIRSKHGFLQSMYNGVVIAFFKYVSR